MSTEHELDTREPDHRRDGSTELDQRAVFRLMFDVPAIRNYAFAAFGALAMIFMVLFEQASEIGGLLIVVVGICGVLFRWVLAPGLILLILTYFMWTPLGIPGEARSMSRMIENRRFDFMDIILVLSVLVYLAAQFRLFGLVYQAIAFEGAIKRKDEPPTRRPSTLINPTELVTLLAFLAAFVVIGQLIWLFATSVEIAPAEEVPVRLTESRTTVERIYQSMLPPGISGRFDSDSISRYRFNREGVLSPGASRFYVLLGMLICGFLLARLVFGYWRLLTLTPAEGEMILLDLGWRETHRERMRLEKWRVWGRKRAEAQAQQDKSTRVELLSVIDKFLGAEAQAQQDKSTRSKS